MDAEADSCVDRYMEREGMRMAMQLDRSFSAEPDFAGDSDDDLFGGVTIRHYDDNDMDMQESNLNVQHSHTTGVGTHAGLSIQSISPQTRSTQMGTDVGMNDGNSDTDMDMHLDCDEPSEETLARSSYDVSHQPRGTSLGTSPLTELIEWIPPPQFGAARDPISGHLTFFGNLGEDDAGASAIASEVEATQEGEHSIIDRVTSPIGSSTGSLFGLGDALVFQVQSQLGEDPEDSVLNPVPGYIDTHDDYESNMKVVEFFECWRNRYAAGARFPPIGVEALLLEQSRYKVKSRISIEDLDGERCDIQGIDWVELGAKREEARVIRNRSYHNYRNLSPDGENYGHSSLFRQSHDHARVLPSCDNHFRFTEYSTRYKARLGQFQLRHLMSAPTRNAIFYATAHGVVCFNSTMSTEEYVMDLTKKPSGCSEDHPARISTLTASDGVLAIGGYNGEYAIKSLYSANDGSHLCGALTRAINSITNHVHTFPDRRSGKPQAVFCSNDDKIRVLDCETNTFIREHKIDWPVNCSATSPDGRLRLVVGDDTRPWVVDAETGRQVIVLHAHRDYGFACDWSPDGRHMVTGNQDGQVLLWDTRRWDQPLSHKTIGTELGGIRSLHFSPLGEGRPVLLMAEPADIISVVDAVTFDTRQRWDFYGEIGGTAFVPDGSAFYVANMDKNFGGIFQFERTGWLGYSPRQPSGRKYTESMSGNDSDGFNSDDDGGESDEDSWMRKRPDDVGVDDGRETLLDL